MKKSFVNNYEALLAEICQVYENTLYHVPQQQGQLETESYWRMGQQLDALLGGDNSDSVYGKRLVERLSAGIKKKYGKGPSGRAIRYMRQFANDYTPPEIQPELTWSHYCVLLSIGDPELRRQFEKRAIKQKMSRRQLQQIVSLTLQRKRGTASSFPLTPRSGKLNCALVKWPTENVVPALDVGFGVLYTPSAPSLKQYSEDTLVHRMASGKWQPVTHAATQRYCYSGTVVDVIDGDTVKMRLQLAPGIAIVERFRLRGIDAMEIDTSEGIRARQALVNMLNESNELTVLTYHTDRYGRYIADLITGNGDYINKQLVEQGIARYLSM